MNKIRIRLADIARTTIPIGYEGEQNHTQVVFYCASILDEHPDAVATMVIKPGSGDPYPQTVSQGDGLVTWDVTPSNVANAGSGTFQFTFTDNDEIIKSVIGSYSVTASIVGSGEAPDPVADWVTEANAALAAIPNTISEAIDDALEEAKESGDFKGDPGEPGAKGDKGDPGDPAPASAVAAAVDDYLEENFSNPSNPPLDRSLTSSLSAAPADLVGDLKNEIKDANNLTNIKWIDGHSIGATAGGINNDSSKSYAEITVTPNTVVKGYTRGGSASTNGAAFYTANGVFVSGATNPAGTDDWYYDLEVPSTAEIFRITCTTTYKENFLCAKPMIVDEMENLRGKSATNTDLSAKLVALNIGNSKVFGVNVYDPNVYRVGSLYVSNGNLYESASGYRASNKASNPFRLHKDDVIGLSTYTGFRYLLCSSSDGSTWTQGSWTTSDTTISENGYYAIVVEVTSQTNITDISAILQLIKYSDSTSFYEKAKKDVENVIPKLEEFYNDFIGEPAFIEENFRIGSLYVSSSTLYESSSTYRISSKAAKPIQLKKGDTVGLTSYAYYKYMLFTSTNGTTWTQGSWTTQDTIISTEAYYEILVEDTRQTTISDISTVFDLLKYVSGSSYVDNTEKRIKALESNVTNPKIAHLSFDDVQYCFLDLQTNKDTYTSIFDNPFFAMLKDLHETYGAVISLYMFITNSESGIAGYPTKFSAEFAECADWLKFGLHQGGTNYESTTAQTAAADYGTFTSNIVNIAGTIKAIDRCPRLGNFKGNSESMVAMRDADAGIVGLLSAYDDRDSYYLSSADSAYVFNHGRLYDTVNRLTFFRSLYAMEATAPTSTLPVLNTLAGANGSDYAILMMHEYGVYGSDYTINTSMKDRLVYACNWAVQNGYVWDFPMNRIIR